MLGFGGLALYALSRGKAIKETVELLEWTPDGIQFKFESGQPTLIVRMNIYNPNRTAVPFKGFVGKLNFKGNAIASFVNTTPVTINSNEMTKVDIRFRVSWLNSLIAAFDKSTDAAISVTGLLKTGLVDVPVGMSYNFKTKAFTRKVSLAGIGYRMANPKPRFIDAFNLHSLKQSA